MLLYRRRRRAPRPPSSPHRFTPLYPAHIRRHGAAPTATVWRLARGKHTRMHRRRTACTHRAHERRVHTRPRNPNQQHGSAFISHTNPNNATPTHQVMVHLRGGGHMDSMQQGAWHENKCSCDSWPALRIWARPYSIHPPPPAAVGRSESWACRQVIAPLPAHPRLQSPTRGFVSFLVNSSAARAT